MGSAVERNISELQNITIKGSSDKHSPDMAAARFSSGETQRRGLVAAESSGNNLNNDEAQGSGLDENEPEVPIPDCIQFRKNGKNDSLLVVTVQPNRDFPVGIPLNSIQSWIRQQACASWYQDENVISRFTRDARRLEEPKEYVIAERKDCCVDLEISRDRLSAWVTVSQSFGGEPFSEELFNATLESNHVLFGIKKDTLEEILNRGWCEKSLIAEGQPPVQGEKTKFEPLVLESAQKGIPQERKNGTVDYKDLGLYLSVTKGTPLLRHIPPTEGFPGKGIDCAPILPLRLRDRALVPGVGTTISPDDPDVIIATREGEPNFDDNSVRVIPTLEIDKVDPSTGNVSFEGNIVIRGGVEAGYTVQAGQDLTVLDTVEGAHLVAGGNVSLMTGAYGRGKCNIQAKGNLEARFLSDCSIQCDGDIEVVDLMSHCFIECQGSVHLGKLGGKGQIIGGNVHALRKFQAKIIGSVSEIETRIEVGPSESNFLRIEKVEKEITEVQKTLKKVNKPIQPLWGQKAATESPGLKELTNKEKALNERLYELKEEQDQLRQKLDVSRNGVIQAEQVYRGAILKVGTVCQNVSDLTTDFYLYQPPE